MGLFSRKNKAEEPFYGSVEAFYDQESPAALMRCVKYILVPDADFEKADSDLGGCTFTVQYRCGWSAMFYLSKKPTSEIKKMGDPNAIHILRYLESRGDCPNAAFFLGVLYEHGLTPETPQNIAEANTHYGIAEAQGSPLSAVLNAIRNDIRIAADVTSHPGEALAFNMLIAHMAPERTELMAALSEGDKDDLLHISTVALAWYTSLGFPLSTAWVGIHLWEYKQRVQKDKGMSDIFVTSGNTRCGKNMCELVLRAAEAGNPYAAACCRSIGLHR